MKGARQFGEVLLTGNDHCSGQRQVSSQLGAREDDDVACSGPACLGVPAEGFEVVGVRRAVFLARRRRSAFVSKRSS